MAQLTDIKDILTKYYKKQKRYNALLFKKMWAEISLTLQNKNKLEIVNAVNQIKGIMSKQQAKSKVKVNKKKPSNTNTTQPIKTNENINEIIKQAIKEEKEENKPVSGAGEVWCRFCRQWVYPEEYNNIDKICLLCKKEQEEGRE